MFSLEHGHGEVAQALRLSLDSKAGSPAQQAWGVQQPIQQPGRVPKETELLLQIDVDAAEKDPLLANVDFVSSAGSVRRDQQRIMPLRSECGHEGVIVQATAAVH